MSVAFLLLGKTNVGFFDATVANRVSTDTPPAGVLGVVEDVGNALGASNAPDALFALDVSIQEDHGLQSEITSHPVEKDSEVTDNIRTLPRVLTIQGLITDTPSGIEALLIVPGLIDRFAATPRSIEIFEKIKAFWQEKKRFDVVTSLEVYQNMAIEDVRFPRNAVVGRSLQFSIRLKEINFASSQVSPDSASSLDGFGEVDVGAQVTQTFNAVPIP